MPQPNRDPSKAVNEGAVQTKMCLLVIADKDFGVGVNHSGICPERLHSLHVAHAQPDEVDRRCATFTQKIAADVFGV